MSAGVSWLTRSVLLTSSCLLLTLLILSAPTGTSISSDSQESPCDEGVSLEGCGSITAPDTDSPTGPPSAQTGGSGTTSTDWFWGGSIGGSQIRGLLYN
jgi:hypothetical protein